MKYLVLFTGCNPGCHSELSYTTGSGVFLKRISIQHGSRRISTIYYRNWTKNRFGSFGKERYGDRIGNDTKHGKAALVRMNAASTFYNLREQFSGLKLIALLTMHIRVSQKMSPFRNHSCALLYLWELK